MFEAHDLVTVVFRVTGVVTSVETVTRIVVVKWVQEFDEQDFVTVVFGVSDVVTGVEDTTGTVVVK